MTKTWGNWLKEQREMQGWTQTDLSKITTIPQTTLSGWETGKVTNITLDERLVLLARAFSMRLCDLPFELLGEKENQEIRF